MYDDDTLLTTTLESTTDREKPVALLLAGLSLLVSLLTAGAVLSDEIEERETDARLACLELPGPNDCGLDGR